MESYWRIKKLLFNYKGKHRRHYCNSEFICFVMLEFWDILKLEKLSYWEVSKHLSFIIFYNFYNNRCNYNMVWQWQNYCCISDERWKSGIYSKRTIYNVFFTYNVCRFMKKCNILQSVCHGRKSVMKSIINFFKVEFLLPFEYKYIRLLNQTVKNISLSK